MKVRLKPYFKNIHPIKGILIKGTSLDHWLNEVSKLGLSLTETITYPIPDITPNSIWGCLIVPKNMDDCKESAHPTCQVIDNRIFIPQYTIIYPKLNPREITRLFPECIHIIHPEIGFAALEEPLDWGLHLEAPDVFKLSIAKPSKGVRVPSEIKRFLIHKAEPADVLEQMEKKVVPQKKTFEDRPLSFLEKIKFSFLKLFLKNDGIKKESKLESFFSTLLKKWLPLKLKEWMDHLKEDYEDLEERNQKQVDKLIKLFGDDPNEALKYAIPLDDDDTGRSIGGHQTQMNLSKRWSGFSLFGNDVSRSGSGPSATISDNHYQNLRDQYLSTANKLIASGDHQKAAFIYFKLLKNYSLAAQTMEKGGHYSEAAAIYLKHLRDKEKAATCYEQASMTPQAIKLYEELQKYEKAGDLYMVINKREEAMHLYNQVVTEDKENLKYTKAAAVLRDKMGQHDRSQEILKEGWSHNYDAFNCLNQYLSNIEDEKQLVRDVENIYADETSKKNIDTFLQVLINEYKRDRSCAARVRDISYDIISSRMKENPDVASELKSLNRDDQVLVKDILRYKRGKR